jgi:hypothetical protein
MKENGIQEKVTITTTTSTTTVCTIRAETGDNDATKHICGQLLQ